MRTVWHGASRTFIEPAQADLPFYVMKGDVIVLADRTIIINQHQRIASIADIEALISSSSQSR